MNPTMSVAYLQALPAPPPVIPAPTPTEWVIETDHLELHYGRKRALDQLSLRIPAGRIHAIVGANGAGKSSLFRILLGFQSPTAGRARILGRDCDSLGPLDRARIGYVNEEHSMPTWLRVNELLAMQRRLYPGWQQARFDAIGGHFQLLPQQRIRELSRGERAGLNLAMALAQQPQLLMLDEPTLGLDVVARRAFLDAVLFAVDRSDCTIIYCSHQMEEIERLADNLIILERGRLLQSGPPDEFCRRIGLCVADFGLATPQLDDLPGLLQQQRLDGLQHLLLLDPPANLEAQLQQRGARRCYRGEVSLERAVNALLARHHARPSVAAEAQP